MGCANIIPPTGGPKDTLPPVLLTATPVEFSKHITGNKIVFKFDEYIDVKDIRTELVVEPGPENRAESRTAICKRSPSN